MNLCRSSPSYSLETSSDKPEYAVEDMEDTAGYVYAKSINLRSGPGEDYKIVREYQQNRKVTITGRSGDWYRVRVGKRKGFMLKEYIKLGDPPESTPKPTEKPKATSKPKATPKAEEIEVITPVETPSEQHIGGKYGIAVDKYRCHRSLGRGIWRF